MRAKRCDEVKSVWEFSLLAALRDVATGRLSLKFFFSIEQKLRDTLKREHPNREAYAGCSV